MRTKTKRRKVKTAQLAQDLAKTEYMIRELGTDNIKLESDQEELMEKVDHT